MTAALTAPLQQDPPPSGGRRERQQAETRRDLSFAAFALVAENGFVHVRVPQIAAAAGVSTRTFNNYFTSKEQAVVWPAAQRANQLAMDLRAAPLAEPLADALVAVMVGGHAVPPTPGMPAQWLTQFREMVSHEPALHGEYLRATNDAEAALAEAIAERLPEPDHDPDPDPDHDPDHERQFTSRVLAALVFGAERAAVRQWMVQPSPQPPVAELVRRALNYALAGIREPS